MGLTEKKRDTLVSIQGQDASIYRKDVALLIAGELPSGWQAVSSSNETFVAFNENLNAYYKEFLPRNRFEKFKSLFRGSRCQRARNQAKLLTKKGFNTPAILCWGKGKSSEFFISEKIKGEGFSSFMITHFLPPLDKNKLIQKRILLHEIGKLIGKLHENGIAHGDLRANNLLVEQITPSFIFNFIDNESNKFKNVLSTDQVIVNLVQISLIPSLLLSRTDILRLFKAYSKIYPRYRENKEILAKVLKTRQDRLSTLTRKAIRQRYCQKTNTISTKYLYGKYLTDSPIEKLIKTIFPFEKAYIDRKKILKRDKGITVWLLHTDKKDIVVKIFESKTFIQQLKTKVRRGKAFHLWEMSLALKELNIPTPKPLGFLTERKRLKNSRNYFFCEALTQHKTLYLIAELHPNFEEWLTKCLLYDITKSLAMMHSNGISHGDTKWKNIIVDEETNKFWWIDLDSTRFRRGFINRWFLKDLARFVVECKEKKLSESFAEKFINLYAKLRNINPEELKKLIEPYEMKIFNRHEQKPITK